MQTTLGVFLKIELITRAALISHFVIHGFLKLTNPVLHGTAIFQASFPLQCSGMYYLLQYLYGVSTCQAINPLHDIAVLIHQGL